MNSLGDEVLEDNERLSQENIDLRNKIAAVVTRCQEQQEAARILGSVPMLRPDEILELLGVSDLSKLSSAAVMVLDGLGRVRVYEVSREQAAQVGDGHPTMSDVADKFGMSVAFAVMNGVSARDK